MRSAASGGEALADPRRVCPRNSGQAKRDNSDVKYTSTPDTSTAARHAWGAPYRAPERSADAAPSFTTTPEPAALPGRLERPDPESFDLGAFDAPKTVSEGARRQVAEGSHVDQFETEADDATTTAPATHDAAEAAPRTTSSTTTRARAPVSEVATSGRTGWLTDDALQGLAQKAHAREAIGEGAVPFTKDDATDGLGARDGGRAFGLEIEFDLPKADLGERQQMLDRIGRDLARQGLTSDACQREPHELVGTRHEHDRGWKFVKDSTVAGEVVSPRMFDEHQTWDNLETVVGVVKEHGGLVTPRVGTHVNFDTADYGHDVTPFNNLIWLANEHQPELYGLATNPWGDGQHRVNHGNQGCTPNVPRAYSEFVTHRAAQRDHGDKKYALNLANISDRNGTRVEDRRPDGSLDAGVIQSQAKTSLALAELAKQQGRITRPPNGLVVPTGQVEDLEKTERLLGQMFRRPEDREQAATVLALVRERRALAARQYLGYGGRVP